MRWFATRNDLPRILVRCGMTADQWSMARIAKEFGARWNWSVPHTAEVAFLIRTDGSTTGHGGDPRQLDCGGTRVKCRLVGVLILAGGGSGRSLDYGLVEKWTKIGFERARSGGHTTSGF